MLYFTESKVECTGCTACKAICPKQCIQMKKDEKGFLYPVANQVECINCGACEKVCPIKNGKWPVKQDYTEQFAAAAITKNSELWEKSASGGAFIELCDAFADGEKESVYIFGAMFEGLRVVHAGKSLEDAVCFCKSKYVQSDMQNCFLEIKKLLAEGKKVIFSGTPCQNAGLKMFLGDNTENLLNIDFICHGVGSEDVFYRFLKEKSEDKKKKIQEYTFRSKKKIHGNYVRHLSKIKYDDGSCEYTVEDNYNKLFLNQLCLRDCCGEACPYRNQNRCSDITIADFNNFSRTFPEVFDCRNYSSVIVNTEKGRQTFENLRERMTLYPCDLSVIKTYNPLFEKTTPENKLRAQFFADFEAGMSIESLCKRYVPTQKNKPVSYIKQRTPYFIKYWVFRLIKTFYENGA